MDTVVTVIWLGKSSVGRSFRFKENIKYTVRKMRWVDFQRTRLLQLREKRPTFFKNVMDNWSSKMHGDSIPPGK